MPIRTADVVVVGAGIAGASAAWALSEQARVILLEQEAHPGHHTTGRSAATYIEGYGGGPVRAITRASKDFLLRPPDGFSPAPLVAKRGVLHVAGPNEAESAHRLAAMLATQGTVHQSGDGAFARRLVDRLHADWVEACVLEPEAYEIDVDALLQGFLRGVRARGGAIKLERPVIGLSRTRSGWRVKTSDGEIDCATVVNAAGAWGDDLARLAGVAPLGLAPLRRTAVVVDAPQGAGIGDWPVVIDVNEAFYFKPEGGRILCSPADETPMAPHDAWPDEFDIALAVDRLQTAADIPVERVWRSWAGLRTFTPDRCLAVGFDPVASGFFWCVGQGGYGVQTAPAVARLVAALVNGLGVPTPLAAHGVEAASFDPARFAAKPAAAAPVSRSA